MSASIYSQNSNTASGTSTSTTVSANAGDTVIVRMFYGNSTANYTNLSCTVNGVAATLVGIAPTQQVAITFVTAPTGSSGSTTIGTAWAGLNGTYPTLLSTGQVVNFVYTQSSTTVTWATTISGSPTTSASAYYSTVESIAFFVAQNVAAGTLTVAATCTSATSINALSAIDVTGVKASSFQAFVPTQTGSGSTAANALAANAITTTGFVFVSAFCWNTQGGSVTPTVGTALAWTGETPCWSGTNGSTANTAQGEYLNVASSGSTVATWTTPSGIQYNGYAIGVVALNVATTSPNTAYSPINTGTTPLDSTGDAGRVALTKVNDDMVAVYSALGGRATTPGCVGISSTTGTTTTLVDSTQTWATNQFFGQYVTITTGTLPTSSGGVTTATSNLGYSALIASNTSTTLTFATLPYATSLACGYEISPVPATAYMEGLATSVGGTAPSTIVDGTKSWTTNAWAGYQVTMFGGPYAGKAFPIASNTATTLTLNSNLTTAIAAGTPYVIGTRSGVVRQKITAGTSATIANGTGIVQIIGPTTMALTTPANPVDGDVVRITNNGTSTITTFSAVANSGQTAPTVPATLTAQQGIAIYYEADTTTWYRLY